MDKGKALYDQAADALCHCRLDVAKSLFTEAGKQYAQYAKTDRNYVDLYKLNAAICFYLAGCYDDAITIIDSIRTTRLEKDLQSISSELYEESRKRKRGSYWETVTGDLKEMKAKGLHKDILRLLKNNPYCVRSEVFAEQMRDSCYSLGMHEIARLFERDLASIRGLI